MRIRPETRLACAAVLCALAVGPGAISSARAQSLVQALSTTYNSNPDLLAQRAVLCQTDETLAQAVSNWRPKVSLSLEYNKIEADSISIRTPPRIPGVGRFCRLSRAGGENDRIITITPWSFPPASTS